MNAAVTNAFAVAAMEMLAYAEGYLDGPGRAPAMDYLAADNQRRMIRHIVRRELGAAQFRILDEEMKADRLQRQHHNSTGRGA